MPSIAWASFIQLPPCDEILLSPLPQHPEARLLIQNEPLVLGPIEIRLTVRADFPGLSQGNVTANERNGNHAADQILNVYLFF